MIDQVFVLKKTIKILEDLKVCYMITGGLAVSLWGQPRTTHDIDLVVAIPWIKKDKIVEIFQKKGFYISKEAVEEALSRYSVFNIIHQTSSFKVDFWITGPGAYDRLQFKRRVKRNYFNKTLYFTAAEDMIIIKLTWAKETHSERHYSDAFTIYEVQKNNLDIKYINKWTKYFKCYNLLKSIEQGKPLLRL